MRLEGHNEESREIGNFEFGFFEREINLGATGFWGASDQIRPMVKPIRRVATRLQRIRVGWLEMLSRLGWTCQGEARLSLVPKISERSPGYPFSK